MRIFFIVLFIPVFAFTQTKDSLYNKNAFVTVGNNKYKVYNNWVSAGAGAAHNFTYGRQQFCLGLNFNFHIKQHYFRAGLLLSGDAFGSYNNYQFHATYGKRIEKKQYNIAAFAGPSFSSGYKKVNGTYYANQFYNEPGIFGVMQFIYKIKYDIGIGPALYIDANRYQTIGGIKLDIYFSSSFIGFVKHDYNKGY